MGDDRTAPILAPLRHYVTGSLRHFLMPTFPRSAVAADHPLASQAGVEALGLGGNAVDAAVTTSFALSVVRPYSCGIGGGGFMMIQGPCTKSKTAVVLDYRETAPAVVSQEYFEHNEDPHASTRSGKAVGIPGTVAGLLRALEQYGTLSREQVLAPAIRIAREGFTIDQHYVTSAKDMISWFKSDAAQFGLRKARFAFMWERFLFDGTPVVGDVLKLPEQADVLGAIARQGKDAFYAGPVARAIIDAIHHDGGEMTLEDLASFVPRTRDAFVTRFREYNVVSMPPPSSGGIVLAQVLSMLETRAIDLENAIAKGHNSADYIHLVAECLKHSFADRARWLGDADFVDVPFESMLDPGRLEAAAKKIDLACTKPRDFYGVVPAPKESGGTSHISVVDDKGNAVACTETINLEFGSYVSSPQLGFCLNDTIDDFAVRAGKPNAFGLMQDARNAPAPGKRPLSAMTPTIVTRVPRLSEPSELPATIGESNISPRSPGLESRGTQVARIIAGGSGGPRIITATLQTILNVMLFGMTSEDAVSAPRFHHQWSPHTLQLEDALLESPVATELRAMEHDVSKRNPIGTVQLIQRRDNQLDAASDPRKGGAPAGL